MMANANRSIWHDRYVALLDNQISQFFRQVQSKQCKQSLETLGALTHFWQDYYAYAVHQTTGFHDASFTGSPDSGGGPYWPSSYGTWDFSGEHPPYITPLEPFPSVIYCNIYYQSQLGPGILVTIAPNPVFQNRLKAAIQFVTDKYSNYLKQWSDNCKCICNINKL